MGISKKEFERIDKLACAAMNLLIQAQLLNGDVANLFIMTGRQDELAKVLDEKRERLAQLPHESQEWLASIAVQLKKQ